MKVKPSYGFEIGISNGGHVRLSQNQFCGDEGVVLLSPHELEILIPELQWFLENTAEWWSAEEKEGE